MPGMLRLSKIFLLALALAIPSLSLGQAAPTPVALTGTWEGTLVRGRAESNMAFTFGMDGGNHTVTITSSALGVFGMPADSIKVDGIKLNIKIARLDLEFYGTLRLNAEGTAIVRIDGDYFQQSEMVPIVLLSVASPTL